jgi:hypothetical protein
MRQKRWKFQRITFRSNVDWLHYRGKFWKVNRNLNFLIHDHFSSCSVEFFNQSPEKKPIPDMDFDGLTVNFKLFEYFFYFRAPPNFFHREISSPVQHVQVYLCANKNLQCNVTNE